MQDDVIIARGSKSYYLEGRADDLKWQADSKPVQNLDQTVYKTVTCSMCLRRTSTKSLKVDPVNNTQKTQHDLGN